MKSILIEDLRNTLIAGGYREFTKSDWYGWAWTGAERFEDGSEPLIKEIERDGRGYIMIYDGNGFSVNTLQENGGPDWANFTLEEEF